MIIFRRFLFSNPVLTFDSNIARSFTQQEQIYDVDNHSSYTIGQNFKSIVPEVSARHSKIKFLIFILKYCFQTRYRLFLYSFICYICLVCFNSIYRIYSLSYSLLASLHYFQYIFNKSWYRILIFQIKSVLNTELRGQFSVNL